MSIFMPTIGLLAIVAFMYWAARFARTRLGLGAGTVGPDALRVVGKRVLEPRKALYVVEIADRYVLVGTAENSVSMIDHITADEFRRMSADSGATVASLPAAAGADAGDDDTPQRFMTVGESFAHFLDKARSSRRARRDVEAQVADAAREEAS